MLLFFLHARLNGYIGMSTSSDHTLLKQDARLEDNVIDCVLFSSSRHFRFVTSGAEELTDVLSPLTHCLREGLRNLPYINTGSRLIICGCWASIILLILHIRWQPIPGRWRKLRHENRKCQEGAATEITVIETSIMLSGPFSDVKQAYVHIGPDRGEMESRRVTNFGPPSRIILQIICICCHVS
jgi:hypothetical protein